MTPLRVELAMWLKGVAWLCIGFFGLGFLASWRDAFPVSFVFLFFVGLGVFLLLVLGPLEMNDQFIRHTSPLTGRCQMNWDEIETIEIAPPPQWSQGPYQSQRQSLGKEELSDIIPRENGDMVLHGRGKRLAIPTIKVWSGKEKEQMIELFNTQIEKRSIKVEKTNRAAWQMSKGARARR